MLVSSLRRIFALPSCSANLGRWGRATPHHWKAMLVKRGEDAVDLAMRTHHVDCLAANCSVLKGLLELVRRARVSEGYTLRDYVLYLRTLVRRWAPEVRCVP